NLYNVNNTEYTVTYKDQVYTNASKYQGGSYTFNMNGQSYTSDRVAYLGDSVINIGNYAFNNCDELITVVVPESLNILTGSFVGDYIFANNEKIENIEFRNNIIGDYMFAYSASLEHILIPESVLQIETYAFAYSPSLVNKVDDTYDAWIVFNNKVVGEYMFYGCENLVSIDLSHKEGGVELNNMESIGYGAFGSCYSLTQMTIPFAGGSALAQDEAETEANLFGYIFGDESNSKEQIEIAYQEAVEAKYLELSEAASQAYQASHPTAGIVELVAYMNSIEATLRQTAQDSVTKGSLDSRLYLVKQTYDGTEAHTYEYYLPMSLRKIVMTGGDVIGYGAFQNVAYLEEITLYDHLLEIHDYAFDGCKRLEAIFIPATVSSIGSYAFQDNHSLETATFEVVDFESLILVINDGTFRNCYKLNNLVLPMTVKRIGKSAFESCTSLSHTAGGSDPFELPASLEEIDSYAFYNCSSLYDLTVPYAYMSTIGYAAFGRCIGLEKLTLPFIGGYESATGEYDPVTVFGYLFGTENHADHETYAAAATAPYGDHIPTNYTGLTRVSVGFADGGLNEAYLGDYFYIPTKLVHVILKNTTAQIVADYAFYDNRVLEIFDTPKGDDDTISSVSGIGKYALAYTTSLKSMNDTDSLNLLPELYSIDEHAFSHATKATALVIPETVGTREVIPNVMIGEYAFEYLTSLVDLDIRNRIISAYQFSHNTSLYKLVIPSKVQTIDHNAFEFCTALGTKDEYGNPLSFTYTTITKILGSGDSEQTYTYNVLQDVYEGDKLLFDAKAQYEKMNSVIKFENNFIGDSMFLGCTGIEVMYVPDHIVKIGYAAFDECTSMTAIYVPFIGGMRYPTDGNNDPIVAQAQNTIYLFGYIFGDTDNLHNDDELEMLVKQAYNTANEKDTTGTDITTAGEAPIPYHPNSVNHVNEFYDFYIPKSLLSIYLADNDTANARVIGHGACMNMENLVSFNFPRTLRYIGRYAFYRTALDNITIPEGTIQIEQGAFQETDISEIIIKNGIIGDSQFYGCEYLKKVTVLSEVVEIGRGAFGGCVSLSELILPYVGRFYNDQQVKDKVTGELRDLTPDEKLIGYLFGTSSNFKYSDLCYAVQQRGDITAPMVTYYLPKSLKRIVITNDTQFSNGAFMNCSYLECISLPEYRKYKGSIEPFMSIGDYAFMNCSSLFGAHYYKDTEQEFMLTPHGVSFENPENQISKACHTVYHTVYDADGVRIENTAELETAQKYLRIPASVTNIGAYAFQNCTSLETIRYTYQPEVITGDFFRSYFTRDGDFVYHIISNDEYEIFINGFIEEGNCLTSISDYAFNGCKNLSFFWYRNYKDGRVRDINTTPGLVLDSKFTSIGNYAFADCDALKSVWLSKTIEEIGTHSFYGCNTLKYITLEEGMQLIGAHMFENCRDLLAVEIPESVEVVREYAFANNSLKDVKIRNHVIGEYMFYNNASFFEFAPVGHVSQITNVISYDKDVLDTIGYAAFGGCTALQKMVLTFVGSRKAENGNTFDSLFGYIFGHTRTELTTVSVWQTYADTFETQRVRIYNNGNYESVNFTTDSRFYVPGSLRNVEILEETVIPYGAFMNTPIEEFRFTTVEEIRDYAFYSSKIKNVNTEDIDLHELRFNNTVKSIGSYAFANVKDINWIYVNSTIGKQRVPSSSDGYLGDYVFANNELDANGIVIENYELGDHMFDGTKIQTLTIPANAIYVGTHVFANNSALTSATIKNEIIGEYMFYHNINLPRAHIPANIKTIGYAAFGACPKIQTMQLPFVGNHRYDENASKFEGLFGYIFGHQTEADALMTEIVQTFEGNGVENVHLDIVEKQNVSVDQTVYKSFNLDPSEGGYHFLVPRNLISITMIDDSVIGDSAFMDLGMVRTFNLCSKTTTIKSHAFENCDASGFVQITLPAKVSSIEEYAFKNCYNLRNVNYNNNPLTQISEGTFYNCYNLEEATILDSVTKLEEYAFYNCISLTSVEVHKDVKEIQSKAFGGCIGLTEMNLPFAGAKPYSELISIINDDTKTTEERTLARKMTLFGYIFGELEPGYERNVFEDALYTGYDFASPLRYDEYSIANQLEYEFYIPKNLKKVTLNNIETIGDYSFSNVKTLEHVVIENNNTKLTTILEHAFDGASNLLDLFIPNTVSTIDGYAFANCSSLETVVFETNNTGLKTIPEYAFANDEKIVNMKVAESLEADLTGLSNTFPAAVTTIEEGALFNNASLERFVVGKTVETIKNNVFGGCISLEELTLPFVGEHRYYTNPE
ncbi:MAG: leucine-rich repeat domain-containing protein, partial [Anaeroplasmataceae bacterium]|nr:leucine-rich repeat domain-containing protein [Anaeroplasmataceae bacterium]